MSIIAIDTETTGLHLHHGAVPFFVSFAFDDRIDPLSWEFSVNLKDRSVKPPKSALREMADILNDTTNEFVLHNAKFDVRALSRILPKTMFDPVEFLERDNVHDTVIQSHVINSNASHGLKDLALRYCDIGDSDQKILQQYVNECRTIGRRNKWAIAGPETTPTQRKTPKGGWWLMDMFLPRAVAEETNLPEDHPYWTAVQKYCETDVWRTLGLHLIFYPEIKKRHKRDCYDERRKLLSVTYRMEENGVSVSQKSIDSEIRRLTKLQTFHSNAAKKIANNQDLNFDSTPQVAKVVYEDLGLPVNMTTATGKPSVKIDVFEGVLKNREEHSKELVDFVLNYVCRGKCSTIIDYLLGYKAASLLDVLHANYNITGTNTTRFSSSNPNAQNISKGKEVFIEELRDFDLSPRKAFGPHDGREWYAVDYTQLQLVIFAYVSKERSMIEAVRNGTDFHTFMQQQIFGELFDKDDNGQRRVAKAVNFGFIFGAGPAKIEATARRPGLYSTLREVFPNATGFIDHNARLAQKKGFLELPNGYPLRVPEDKPYAATNYLIQGTEGIIVQRAMVWTDAYIQNKCPDAFLTLNVHDELVFDFKKDDGADHIGNICQYMEQAGSSLGIHCKVDAKYIEKRWDKGVDVHFS